MEEEVLVEGKTAENVLAVVIVCLFIVIFCFMVHSQKSKGAAKGHWFLKLIGFAGSSGTTKISKRPPAAAFKAVNALAKLGRGARTKKTMRAFVGEVQKAKNARQRGDLLELMEMKLRKAMEQSITDVEREEEEAAVEHGDAEAAAKAAEQQSMRSLTAKLMGAQKAAKGMAVTLTEDHHAHLRQRAIAGCADSRAVLDEENERMLARQHTHNAVAFFLLLLHFQCDR